MKKISIPMLLIFILGFIQAHSQFSYSIRFGINGCHDPLHAGFIPKYQFTSGISARIHLGKHSRLSLSANYSRKSMHYSEEDWINEVVYADITKTTLEIPLLYEYHLDNGLFFGLGQFVDRTFSFIWEGYKVYQNENSSKTPFDFKNTINRVYDRGPCAAIGMTAKSGVGVQLLYTVGRELFKSEYDIDASFRNLSFTAFYTFSSNKNSAQNEN